MTRLGFLMQYFRRFKTSIGISLAFLIPASIILLGYFWVFKTVFNPLDLVFLMLAVFTIVYIRRLDKNVYFLNKVLGGYGRFTKFEISSNCRGSEVLYALD